MPRIMESLEAIDETWKFEKLGRLNELAQMEETIGGMLGTMVGGLRYIKWTLLYEGSEDNNESK